MDSYTYVDCFLDSGSPANIGTRDKPIFNLLPGIRNAEAMCVMAVTIPFSYFVIDAASNKIQITVNNTGLAGNVYNLYLVPGTYTNGQFITMFTEISGREYNASSPWDGGVEIVSGSGDAANDLSSLVLFIYGTTNQISIYSLSLQFTLNFNIEFNCAQTLGFNTTTTYPTGSTQYTIYTDPSTPVGPCYYVEAPNTVQMTGPPYIYIQSDLAGQVRDGACRTEQSKEQILTAIRVNNNYTGMINYAVLGAPEKLFFSKADLTKIEFSLRLGFRTQYCPGLDSSYYNANGSPIATNYLQLLGQSFQIQIRFYARMDTVSRLVMNNTTGDKVTTTDSIHNSTGRPSEVHFRGRQITTDMTGPRTTGNNPSRSSTFPIRRPSEDLPTNRHPYKRRAAK